MDNPILAIAIDMFSPGAYRASTWPSDAGPQPDFVEDYAHERGYVYLVLQPLLFRGSAHSAAGVDVLPNAADYFSTGRTLSPSDVVFADGKLEKRMPVGLMPVPVALPPGCRVRLDLKRGNAVVWTTEDRVLGTDEATGGTTSPFMLSLGDWPEIAAANFSHPLATKFVELDTRQREEVYVWIGAAIVDLIRLKDAGSGAPLTPAQSAALNVFALSDLPPTPERMREHLIKAGRGEQIYNLLLSDPGPADPKGVKLSAPRFKVVDGKAFASRIEADILDGLPGAARASYLQVWWAAMCKQAKDETGTSWPDASQESKLAMALGRYFGFGERLRWPTSGTDVTGPDNKVFMVPRKPSGTRFETNAASLCELVVRIPVSALQRDANELRISLTVAGKTLDDEDRSVPNERLAWLLREMSDSAAQWPMDRTCHAQARHDSQDEIGTPMEDERGLVLVQTRSAQCIPMAIVPNVYPYAVPSVFYDLVDSSARLSRNDDGDGLTLTSRPRRALFPEECLAFDEATAGCSTAWGLQGDLHAAAVSALPHSSKRPRVYEFVASRLSDVIVDRVAESATASEALRFKAIVGDVLSSKGRYIASLWLPGGAGVINLDQALVDADGAESDLRFYLLDEDPDTGIGAALAKAGVDASKAIGAEIVISVKAGHADAQAATRYLPFNRLLRSGPGDAPWLALERAALSRVSRSVDRWIERFHVEPETAGTAAAGTDPVQAHLSNFNKLRVYRRRFDNTFIPITYPDAAVPLQPAISAAYRDTLPWNEGWPSQPPFSYFVAHLYSQENATERPEIGVNDTSQDRQPEMMRYERYAHPRANEWITGYLEHQYSYRIPVLGRKMAVDARIATDVRNPAGLVARAGGTAAALKVAQREEEGLHSPLLELRMSKDGLKLLLACRQDYLRAALSTQDKAVKMQGAASNNNVDTLRSIYEAIQDFMASMVDGQADLIVHLYRFDNQLPRAAFQSQGAQSIPARLQRFTTGRLRLRADMGPGQALVKGLASLAPPSFEEFRREVERLRNGAGGDIFPAVELDMGQSGWSWLQEGASRTAPDLQAEANIVRMALDLARSPQRVVGESCAGGRFIPLTPDGGSQLPMWIDGNVGQVVSNAKAELSALVKRPAGGDPGSSLFFRRDWLHAEPPAGEVVVENGVSSDAVNEPRSKRWKMIFGDYAPTVLVPLGKMHDVKRVCELFYIPLAFLPLQDHHAMVSADETTLFAEFLLGVAGEILQGKPITGIPIQASAPAQASHDAVRARLRLEALSRVDSGIGHQLQQLMHAVHNDSDLRSSTDPLVVRALACLDASRMGADRALRELLSATPQTFVTARAIGLVLFDPTQQRFPRSLQSIQLCKRISQNMQASQGDGLVDVDRFVIPPTPAGTGALLLDPLESARYDSEFELLSNTYRGISHGGGTYGAPIDLGGAVRVTARGGASGRSGEDFVESSNHFPLAGDADTTSRAVEVDAPHWNPHWAYKVAGSAPRQLYLLPSRRFPVAPVTLQVSTAKPPVIRVSGTSINLTDLDGKDAQKVFKSAVAAALDGIDKAGLVIRADGATDSFQKSTEWAIDSKSTRLASCEDSAGWHKIDTFLEHHYFLVESGEVTGGDDAFANDGFEIEVRVNRDGQKSTAPAPAPATALPKAGATSNLLEAFRATQQGIAGTVSKPTASAVVAMHLPALVESLAHWLCDVPVDGSLIPDDEKRARATESLLQKARPPVASAEPIHFRAVYAIATPDRVLDVEGPLQTPPSGSERIGSIVTVTTFKADAAVMKVRGERRILRVSVLADPWSRLQVRVKQMRNQRDVDGGKPDMDAAFAMASPYSSWSGYAHAEYVVDAKVFALSNVPETERRLEVTSISLEQWLEETGKGGSPDIGGLVGARLCATVPGHGAYSGQPYWTHEQMLGSIRKVSVVLRQRQPDRHLLHDQDDQWTGRPERDLFVPRHVFGILQANQVDANLSAVAAKTVTAGEPELEITWLDQANAGPVYRVTWPIRFLHLRSL